MKYIITIQRAQFGVEEYDGGSTLEAARKEAKFFIENTPTDVPVKICTVDGIGRLILKEVCR